MTSHNIIANLAKMGVDTATFGACGNDIQGEIAIKSLEKLKVDTKNILVLDDVRTRCFHVSYYDEEGKIVDLWFHDMLDFLYNEEEKYFNEHDSFVLKIKKVTEYYKVYGSFGVKKITLVGCNGIRVLDKDWCHDFREPRITEEEIDEMLKVYEDVDKIMKAKTIEIQTKLGWTLIED